jgi:hypothetical protein
MNNRSTEPGQLNRERNVQVGISQLIRLEWLEQTANLVLAGNAKVSINTSLQELLQDKVSVGGDADRGNREKIITILMKIWLNVPRGLEAFRTDGLELWRSAPPKDRIAIHWGMVTAVYPFWGSVASQVGRLLHLQGSFAITQIQRRLREQYGERETVFRAARRVIHSYVDWGVLRKTEAKGVYKQEEVIKISEPRLVVWLIEAHLYAHPERKAILSSLLNSPFLFPMNLSAISMRQLEEISDRLEITKVDMNDFLVTLHQSGRF